jgi:hypothetical protein
MSVNNGVYDVTKLLAESKRMEKTILRKDGTKLIRTEESVWFQQVGNSFPLLIDEPEMCSYCSPFDIDDECLECNGELFIVK